MRIAVTDLGSSELRLQLQRVPGLRLGTAQDTDLGAAASATLEGAIQPLVQALAPLQLTDLVIEEPDLEESVLTLYGKVSVGSEP